MFPWSIGGEEPPINPPLKHPFMATWIDEYNWWRGVGDYKEFTSFACQGAVSLQQLIFLCQSAVLISSATLLYIKTLYHKKISCNFLEYICQADHDNIRIVGFLAVYNADGPSDPPMEGGWFNPHPEKQRIYHICMAVLDNYRGIGTCPLKQHTNQWHRL